MTLNLNRRYALTVALVVAVLIVAVSIVATHTRKVSVTSVDTEELKPRTAGVITAVNSIEITAFDDESTIEEAQIQVVASPEDGEVAMTDEYVEDAPALVSVNSEWADKLMADVENDLSVRKEPSKEAELVGKLRRGDLATIIGETEGWYEITSGEVTGFVSADYAVVGDAVEAFAEKACKTYATTTTAGLRVRKEASEDAKVLAAVAEGTKLTVDTEREAVDGWVAVTYESSEGYVKAEYVEVEMVIGQAITREEELRIIAEKKAAEAKAKKEQLMSPSKEVKAAVTASYDELAILAAIIQVEAGHECYEGQVAVGAVVMNRVRSGSYPNSISDVVFQRGQFASGKVSSVLASGPKASCMQAAQDAINGIDNVGGCTHFRPVRSGHPGYVIGNHVFF